MAKHAGTHSAAQRTTATFPHLICKAIPLPSHSVHSVHLFVISMSRLHLFCPLRQQGGGSGGKEETSSQGDHSATTEHLTCSPPLPKKIHTHIHPTHWASTLPPLPRLTNVPWHSYITRKLAKWINHGPCLALRALNGFSPLQVCPIIAFIHLVEARFTHSLRSCQSPGYIFRSGGKSVRDLSSDHNRLFKQQLTWQLHRMSMSGSLLDRTLVRAMRCLLSLHLSAYLLPFPYVSV